MSFDATDKQTRIETLLSPNHSKTLAINPYREVCSNPSSRCVATHIANPYSKPSYKPQMVLCVLRGQGKKKDKEARNLLH